MNLGIHEVWDVASVPPSVTRLYNLPPIGLGTPMVECLSSYIHRLADAHGVPTWVLVCREFGPLFERKSIIAANGHCDLFGKMGMALNGNNASALEAVTILGKLTGARSLLSLTFSRLGRLVAPYRILRGSQAWCPACLEQWREEDQPIYLPLIWLLSSLRTCPIHGCQLEDRCPTCGKPHTSLTRYRWNGQCPKCSAWLGKFATETRRSDSAALMAWEEFTSAALDRFMVAMQTLPTDPPVSCFAGNVINLARHKFDGNFSKLARTLQVHRITVADWAAAKRCPSPLSLVGLSYCFGIDAIDWVVRRVDPSDGYENGRSIDPIVAEILRPPLRRHEHQLVRASLVKIIHANVYPPQSFKASCKSLGVNQCVAKRKHPELANQIISRFRTFHAENRRMRELTRKTVVESAVNQLLWEGKTLSYNQLAKVLPPGVSACDRIVRNEFRRLRQAAEADMQAALSELPSNRE